MIQGTNAAVALMALLFMVSGSAVAIALLVRVVMVQPRHVHQIGRHRRGRRSHGA
ncbi:hypothetical protein FHU30_002734 [Actinomadura rupiterrae]|nr:hypothetical protein [Actinomadura rupiterrae]